MQHVENDMEDLFKRAGDNYSPQKGKGDWESIAKQIADKLATPEITAPVRNGRNKKILPVFLWLFILSIGLIMIKNPRPEKSFLAGENKLLKNTYNHFPETTKNYNPYSKRKHNVFTFSNSEKTKGKYEVQTMTSSDYHASPHQNSKQVHHPERWENQPLSEAVDAKEKYILPWQNLNENSNKRRMEKPEYAQSLQERKTAGAEKEIRHFSTDKTIKKEKSASFQKETRLYFGVVAAPDFSKVQSASFNSTGVDAGLLLGFRLNVKLSIESGLSWNKKRYSSDGKNFNMDKVSPAMPAGMIINNLEGQSSLIEIPLKIKYDITRAGNSAAFITAGVSSYVMTKEKNKYNITMNGSSDKISGVYKKNNYSLPAVANISFGYQHIVYGHVALRIEPFLKVPLRGIGVGSLPVTSTGLQVGIISRFK